MTDVAAPRSVNYTDTLPLAIASTQNRRSFYPQKGQAFTDTGSNIIITKTIIRKSRSEYIA